MRYDRDDREEKKRKDPKQLWSGQLKKALYISRKDAEERAIEEHRSWLAAAGEQKRRR